MVKKWFLNWKLSLLRASAITALNTHFWVKNHFLTLMTPKPAYIYSNNFLRETLKKFWSHGTPLGYLGSLSWDPLGRIFSKCVFLNLLNPLGLPIPSNAMEASKKLKNFPRGCDHLILFARGLGPSAHLTVSLCLCSFGGDMQSADDGSWGAQCQLEKAF